MKEKTAFTPEDLRYLRLLAKQYPTLQSASNETIRLESMVICCFTAVYL